MRRAGHNPTDIEVQDMINKIDSDSGTLNFKVKSSKSFIEVIFEFQFY